MVTMDNYEEYLLLYADGELGEAEQKELLAFISQHPELKAEMDIYAATKLVPDEAMVYSGKEQLMKTAPVTRSISFRSWWVYGAAAACIALFIVTGLRNNSSEPATTPVAHTTTEIKSIDTPVYEELHSTPKNPVAVETKQTPAKAVYVAKNNAPARKKANPVIQEPVIVKKSKPENHSLPVAEQPKPTTPTENNTHETIIARANGDEETVTLPKDQNIKDNKRGLLASLPVKENLQGLNELSKNVGERLEKIKDIPGKIKDTDIRFKLGKKELFVVRL